MKNGGRLAGRLPWGKACGSGLVLEAGKDFLIRFHHIAQVLAEDPSQIVLADEISPDTCRFWDLKTNEKLDKDRFRRDLGRVREAYEEILARLEALKK